MKFNGVNYLTLFLFLGLVSVIAGAGYNESCSSTPDCNLNFDLYLICYRERCLCDSQAIYINDVSGCHLKAKEICAIPDGVTPTQNCVPYSECQIGNGELESKCWCKSPSGTLPSGLCPKMSYEEPCTEDDEAPCDPPKFLWCNPSDHKCVCLNQINTIFDTDDKTCKLLTGENCQNDKLLDPNQQCVDRAICFRNVCECDVPFETNPSRQCTIPHGESCNDSANKPCNADNHQECRFGTCSCSNPNDSYFDPGLKTCYLFHGARCSQGRQPCAPNSYCDIQSSQCKCYPDLHPNELRRCTLGLDDRCDVTNSLCDELQYLECNANSGKCSCRLESETVFDPISQKCQLLANAPCTPTDGAQSCIQDSSCQVSGDENLPFKCKCTGSLESNKNRQCFLPFDSRCGNDLKEKCDPAGFLQCNTSVNTCQCLQSGMEYVASEKMCYLLPNSSCSVIGDDNPPCGNNSRCEKDRCTCRSGYEPTGRATCLRKYGYTCRENEECNFYKNNVCVNDICGCQSGNIEDETSNDHYCYSDYRQNCSAEVSCYFKGYLNCVAGLCNCLSPSEQKYFPEVRKCLSLPGMRCHLNAQESDVALHCLEHAFCIPDGSDPYGNCTCAEGYKPNYTKDKCTNATAAIQFWSTLPIAFILLIHSYLS